MITRLFLALAALVLTLAASGPGAAQQFNPQQQGEIRAIVRDYLINNPDVLKEALDALAARQKQARLARMVSDARDYSVGPANARIVVVEFFDYRCPFCMAALPWVTQTLQTRRDVRFVFKELPLPAHGEPAMEAARASLAALPQGHYVAFHRALMGYNGNLTSQQIDAIARSVGIDVAQMRRRMNDPAITRHLEENAALAYDSDVDGTPGFFINGEHFSGFRDGAPLDAAIAKATREQRGPWRP